MACARTDEWHTFYRGDESRRCIQLYNRVAQALVEYQFLYHKAWVQTLPKVMEALSVRLHLNATVLVNCSIHTAEGPILGDVTGPILRHETSADQL